MMARQFGEIQINIYAEPGPESDMIYRVMVDEIQRVMNQHDCKEFAVAFAQVEEPWPIFASETVSDGYGSSHMETYIEEWIK